MCGTKPLVLREMLNMDLNIILQRWLTVVGVCVVVGGANICTEEPQGWLRRVLYKVTEYLSQVTGNLRGDSECDLTWHSHGGLGCH